MPHLRVPRKFGDFRGWSRHGKQRRHKIRALRIRIGFWGFLIIVMGFRV